MKRLLWLGCWLLVSTTSMFPAGSFAGDDPPASECKLRQRASIELTIVSNVLVPVTLDGVSGFMKLNSGLPIATISLLAAKERKLRMKNAPEPFSNLPGVMTIDSLSLGSYNLGKVQLLVTSGQIITNPGSPPSIGAFALPSLLVDYELHFAHKKLNLFSTNHCPGNVVKSMFRMSRRPMRGSQQ